MRIEQVGRLRWILLDESGTILLITSSRKIAERYVEQLKNL